MVADWEKIWFGKSRRSPCWLGRVPIEHRRLILLMAVSDSAVSLHYTPRLSNSLKLHAHRHTFYRRIVLLGRWFSLPTGNILRLMSVNSDRKLLRDWIDSMYCRMTHIFTLAVSVKWSLCHCLLVLVLMILAKASFSLDKHLVWPLFPCHLQTRLLASVFDGLGVWRVSCLCVWV